MPLPSIIAIGASAGGVKALLFLAASLPRALATPVLVVLHVGEQRSELPALLSAAGPMPAKHAEDGEAMLDGHIYVAPPDRHMIVVDGRLRLTRGPKENRARPAIDPLFRSLAEAYGPRVVGVILTGKLDDGTLGLFEVKRRGGVAVAQDPDDAEYPGMPRSAGEHVVLDYCPPLADLPMLIERLAEGIGEEAPMATDQTISAHGAETPRDERFDRPLTITCPDCGGALRKSQTGPIVKYACHIGHTYTAEILGAAQFSAMEKTMRAAVRCLNERAEFCRQMADEGASQNDGEDRGGWRVASAQALERAYDLRDFVEQEWSRPGAPGNLVPALAEILP